MRSVALDVMTVLKEKHGVDLSKDQITLIKGLPALMERLEEEEKEKGLACHVDRAYARMRDLFNKFSK